MVEIALRQASGQTCRTFDPWTPERARRARYHLFQYFGVDQPASEKVAPGMVRRDPRIGNTHFVSDPFRDPFPCLGTLRVGGTSAARLVRIVEQPLALARLDEVQETLFDQMRMKCDFTFFAVLYGAGLGRDLENPDQAVAVSAPRLLDVFRAQLRYFVHPRAGVRADPRHPSTCGPTFRRHVFGRRPQCRLEHLACFMLTVLAHLARYRGRLAVVHAHLDEGIVRDLLVFLAPSKEALGVSQIGILHRADAHFPDALFFPSEGRPVR